VLVLAVIKRKSFNISIKDFVFGTAFVISGVFIGATALYSLGQILMNGRHPEFWTWVNWSSILRAGGPLYGAVLGAIGMVCLYGKLFRRDIIELLSFLSLSFFGANFLTRMGCLFAGCCYGILLPSGARFPYQLVEGLLCLAIFIALLIWRPERKYKQEILPLTLIAYAVIRFVLEFFRGDAGRGEFLALSSSQWIALLIIAAMALFMVVQRNRANEVSP